MSIIFLLIPLSIVIATGFLAAFIWAVRSGQYDDTCTPAMRLLHDSPAQPASDPVRQVRTAGAPTIRPTEERDGSAIPNTASTRAHEPRIRRDNRTDSDS